MPYQDTSTRLAVESDILRVNPNALIQIYDTGTTNLIWGGTADKNGFFSCSALSTGTYDIKVNGELVKTIEYVPANHTHKPSRTWSYQITGTINADQEENSTIQIYGSTVAGKIKSINLLAQSIDATADFTVHVLKAPAGQSGAGAALEIANDSVWNYRVYPGSAQNRFMHNDSNLGSGDGLTVSANDTVTIGVDYTAGSVVNLTVEITFVPD